MLQLCLLSNWLIYQPNVRHTIIPGSRIASQTTRLILKKNTACKFIWLESFHKKGLNSITLPPVTGFIFGLTEIG